MKIFYDVDTQNDFMNSNGALYVPGAELIKPALAQLVDCARINNIPVLGSVDKHFGTEEYGHRESELQSNGGPFPDHCMNGTKGELKIYETIVYHYNGKDPIDDEIKKGVSIYVPHLSEAMNFAHQIDWAKKAGNVGLRLRKSLREKKRFVPTYFEKQSYDVFTNPAAEYFFRISMRIDLYQKLSEEKFPRVNEAVVYGVATDYCVKAAVLGMQKRGIQCYVVEDAIKGVTPETEKAALAEMLSSGAKLTTVETILTECLKQKAARK